MPEHHAALDAYDGVEIVLPSGKEVRFRCLTVSEGARFWRLLMKAEAGDAEAQITILVEFPKAIGMDPDSERLTPAEVYEVLRRFLSLQRAPVKETTASETTPEALSSIGGSTT